LLDVVAVDVRQLVGYYARNFGCTLRLGYQAGVYQDVFPGHGKGIGFGVLYFNPVDEFEQFVCAPEHQNEDERLYEDFSHIFGVLSFTIKSVISPNSSNRT